MILVDTTDEAAVSDGNCSISEAISAANLGAMVDNCDGTASDAIAFDLGTGTPMITVAGELPEITAPVTILGNTGGATRVELRGPGGMGPETGLFVAATAPGTVIRKMVINSFPNAGISIEAADVTVTGSFIGTNADGTIAMYNFYGITADATSGLHIGGTSGVTPGGPCTGDCNLISGNEEGVFLGTDAVLEGNFIGTNAAGTSALPNVAGVKLNPNQTHALVGGTAPGAGNLISGNSEFGIYSEQALTIQGNRIGTNAAGTGAVPNGPQAATTAESFSTAAATALRLIPRSSAGRRPPRGT
ncbi:MAG: hypothetical protein WD904_04800 [Dehalococcoidia bacterium]